MKKQSLLAIPLIFLLILQIIAVGAISTSDAREAWKDSKEESKNARILHREAKAAYAEDASQENRDEFLDTGRDSMHAALNEAEAWLIWKEAEASESTEITDDLKETILEDIQTNKDKLAALREEVNAIKNEIGLVVVFLRMMGKYAELLTDVARNSGKVWIQIANNRIENLENYEAKLRSIAESQNDPSVLNKLDLAKQEIEKAKEHVGHAEGFYENVRKGQSPLAKFHEGNLHLRLARTNMVNAHRHLNQALGGLLPGP